MEPLANIVASYNPSAPLAQASTIPGSWYTDFRIAELERQAVFSRTWQMVARAEQLAEPGQYVTAEVANEPVVVVRGGDGILRAFFNVCRHHAAAVMTEPAGKAPYLRCPYHGWTYSLEGTLKGVPEFDGVSDFDRAKNSLVPIPLATWETFVFVHLAPDPPSLPRFLGDLVEQFRPLEIGKLHFIERREYLLQCNWKVFVDNFLDGGYHVPHLHKGLNSVLEYKHYTIQNFEHFSLQSSPLQSSGDQGIAAVRKGQALYYWVYPNLMLNWYEGYLETNLVIPLAIDRMKVVFDFYLADSGEAARERNRQSIGVSDRIQMEDQAICESVQRGLASRAYGAGRLSVRREAGEHLFHRLLHADLKRGLDQAAVAGEA